MKRGILVATLMMTAAGVASANLLTTAPQAVVSPGLRVRSATEPVAIVAAPVLSGTNADRAAADRPDTGKRTARPEAAAPAKVTSAETTQKSLVEAHQAPVPFKLKPRP